jgi:hypothetical protein
MPLCSKERDSGAVELDSRFRLTLRTSMLSEYRDAAGRLGAVEFNHQFATTGSIRNALIRIPGVEFELHGDSAGYAVGRTRFKFKDRLYELSAPYQDVRIAPAERGAAYRETDELMRLLNEYLLPKWQNRARSRFYRT